MIEFIDVSQDLPYKILKQKYDEALINGQRNIDAIVISSFNKEKDEVDSRYVNLKFISNNEFIFFSNYESPKASAFKSNRQIAALLYWPVINTQIRIKAKIKKTSVKYNQNYFSNRLAEKNALAISSNQSRIIDSFDKVEENFKRSLKNNDLKECPKYWGGFSFTPYEIEFWEGSEFRLNKRNLFVKDKKDWNHFILEP